MFLKQKFFQPIRSICRLGLYVAEPWNFCLKISFLMIMNLLNQKFNDKCVIQRQLKFLKKSQKSITRTEYNLYTMNEIELIHFIYISRSNKEFNYLHISGSIRLKLLITKSKPFLFQFSRFEKSNRNEFIQFVGETLNNWKLSINYGWLLFCSWMDG